VAVQRASLAAVRLIAEHFCSLFPRLSSDSYTNPGAIQRFARIIAPQTRTSANSNMGRKKTKKPAGDVIAARGDKPVIAGIGKRSDA